MILARLHAQNWIVKGFPLPICAQFYCKAFVSLCQVKVKKSQKEIILISYGRITNSFVFGGNENKLISFWDFLTFTNKN